MRREPAFLRDIISACRKIEAIVASTTEAAFLQDEVMPAAVLHHLTVIGEAIGRLTTELKDRYPQVPCPKWDAAASDIPQLREQVLSILHSEFAEAD